MKLFLDIETLPVEQGTPAHQLFLEKFEQKLEGIKAPSNYGADAAEKFIAKKRAEMEEEMEEAYRRTALDGRYGRVLAIGYSIDGADPQVIINGNEEFVLTEFADVMFKARRNTSKGGTQIYTDNVTVVGHNVLDFDLRFLYQRAVINNLVGQFEGLLKSTYKFGEVKDTMKDFAGYRGTISLDNLCRLLGIEGKSGMTGADVYGEYMNQNLMGIGDYCKDDVSKVIEIEKRLF